MHALTACAFSGTLRSITLATVSTDDELEESPLAQQVFQKMDTDNSGHLSTEEVLAYFLKGYSADIALKLMRVLGPLPLPID